MQLISVWEMSFNSFFCCCCKIVVQNYAGAGDRFVSILFLLKTCWIDLFIFSKICQSLSLFKIKNGLKYSASTLKCLSIHVYSSRNYYLNVHSRKSLIKHRIRRGEFEVKSVFIYIGVNGAVPMMFTELSLSNSSFTYGHVLYFFWSCMTALHFSCV